MVLDTSNEHTVATLPIGGWVDTIHIDQKRQRIYVTVGVGRIDTYTIEPNDTYHRQPEVETALLGKTGLYSNELDRLYVSVPQSGLAPAQILVLKPSP